jgi:hypothetical protein
MLLWCVDSLFLYPYYYLFYKHTYSTIMTSYTKAITDYDMINCPIDIGYVSVLMVLFIWWVKKNMRHDS